MNLIIKNATVSLNINYAIEIPFKFKVTFKCQQNLVTLIFLVKNVY